MHISKKTNEFRKIIKHSDFNYNIITISKEYATFFPNLGEDNAHIVSCIFLMNLHCYSAIFDIFVKKHVYEHISIDEVV